MKTNKLYFFNNYSFYISFVLILAITSTTLFIAVAYFGIKLLSQINILKSDAFFSNDSSIIILFSLLIAAVVVVLLLTLLIWNKVSLRNVKINLYAKMIKVEVNNKIINIDKDDIVKVSYKKSKNDKRSRMLLKTKNQTFVFMTPALGKVDVDYLKNIVDKIS